MNPVATAWRWWSRFQWSVYAATVLTFVSLAGSTDVPVLNWLAALGVVGGFVGFVLVFHIHEVSLPAIMLTAFIANVVFLSLVIFGAFQLWLRIRRTKPSAS